MCNVRVGRILLVERSITEEQLKQALRRQRDVGGRIGSRLLELGFVDERTLVKALQKNLGVKGVIISDYPLEPDVLNLISPDTARAYGVIPLKCESKMLYLAMVNPKDVQAQEDIRFRTGYDIVPFVAVESSINKVLADHYETKALEDQVVDEMGLGEETIELLKEEEEEVSVSDLAAQVDSGPVVQYVNYLLKKSVEEGASDLHVEPYDKDIRVRMRLDGILHETTPPPYRLHKAVVSRLKVMSNLKIQEKRKPQDGRFEVRINGRRIDFRISTVPTIFGEKVALRILDSESITFDLTTLGFEERALTDTMNSINRPHGIILVTGPTGSGKTTTLYSILREINTIGVNISTAEDPVEYTLFGVNQVQVKEEIGLNFVSCLKSFLRQDPDIIMVGEIRDKATTDIAIRASLTGHLVLSTVHTNSAAATITRLINMGLPPFLLASTLELIISQRLVRKICPHCKAPHEISNEEILKLGFSPDIFKGKEIFHGIGCDHCKGTGFKGRLGLFEALPLSTNTRKLIIDGATSDEIEKQAKEEGMRTLRDEGIEKVLKGLTDIDEIAKETLER
ncbi:Flp pilus assembly complex ATPase component TadA [candidate division WOR-3 bacterium]|nr:Flp pilus assembly complex ATPase component TadA [candidate division WOR-3 bacterium]